ncbi:hypothetical protein A2U01_0013363, partial [Trifolium medium]|nr:hypothetical protein [Trifolium medium]
VMKTSKECWVATICVGCGGVIKGSDDEWIGGFAKRLRLCSAYMAED